jgi:hypothetical protein
MRIVVKGAAPAGASSISLEQAMSFALDHRRPVEQLLSNWEGMISQQASGFQKFAPDVGSVVF